MNTSLKTLITLTTGLAVGGVVGYYVAIKKAEAKWQGIAEEEIEQVRTRYGAIRKEGYESPSVTEQTAAERLVAKVTAEQNKLLSELGYSEDQIEDYRAGVPDADLTDVINEETFQQRLAEDIAEATPREEIDEEDGVASEEERRAFAASDIGYNVFDHDESEEAGPQITDNYEHLRVIEADRQAGKPYIMSVDEFMEDDSYEKISITFYEGDGVLADERDMPIDDEEKTVGEKNLERFGWESKDKNVVYVRNDRMEVFFEISRSDQAYTDMVAGMPQTRSSIGKFRADD